MPATAVSESPSQLLSVEQATQLALLTDGLDATGLIWVSGYIAGLARRQALSTSPPPSSSATIEAVASSRPSIVYGSQTGNAKRLAEDLAQQLEQSGVRTRLLSAAAYPLRELRNESHLILVVSTQGDGDPPDDARALVDFVEGKRAPALKSLKYAVLGLGDSSYPQFNAIGRRLDERLAELGASRWLPRADADLDIDTVAQPWLSNAVKAAREALLPPLASVTSLRPALASTSEQPKVSREKPFLAELLVNQRITARNSHRDVRHVELSLESVDLRYEPGDAIGVWPANAPALVHAILQALQLDADEEVGDSNNRFTLVEWLSHRKELTRLSRPFIARLAAISSDASLEALLAPEQSGRLSELVHDNQVLDLLLNHPGKWSGQTLIDALRPLAPRLYSIASSRKAVGDEAHLTIAHLQYGTNAGERWGAASNFIARTTDGNQVPVFVESNDRFRLPRDSARDVIMIGAGTGVAPFRAFVQERTAIGAGGRNWLLFGNTNGRDDFLYQVEWQEALKHRHLDRLDVAFSRERPQKTYVQHRLAEHGREVYAWLESGASLYVCGGIAMGKAVEETLVDVIATHGARNRESAIDHVRALQQQGRYARDLY
ncbi:MAG: sulfite reductase flavoprotein alpha-component [Xanthomonadaceae bacterium]|nr:sulfite reductase flavoprotein alpha-component [Xanthomonadaceae bacterium]